MDINIYISKKYKIQKKLEKRIPRLHAAESEKHIHGLNALHINSGRLINISKIPSLVEFILNS